jgi:mRNA-degrading endonuclease toxin of MazEF toxin-antitoxin module
MTQFEVWSFDFEQKGGLHPCVVISHPDIAARGKYVNILFCTSQTQSRPIKPFEVLLDTADGLSWETFCDCSVLWVAERTRIVQRRGTVTHARRNTIRAQLRDIFQLMETD